MCVLSTIFTFSYSVLEKQTYDKAPFPFPVGEAKAFFPGSHPPCGHKESFEGGLRVERACSFDAARPLAPGWPAFSSSLLQHSF